MTVPRPDRWPDARALAERLARQAAGSVRVVILYGSRLLETSPDRYSALDFVVVVGDYRAFYRGLAAAGELHRPVGLMTALARVLPPNVIAYAPGEGRDARQPGRLEPEGSAHRNRKLEGLGRDGFAKCLVVSESDLVRALGPRPPDHFLLGRLIQRVGVVWAADPEDAARVLGHIEGAQRRVLDWMVPYLDEPVDGAGLGRRLLEVCYRGELRPESRGRAGRVFEAQEEHFTESLRPALEAGVREGRLRPEGDRYALAGPVSSHERRRWRRYFRRSKARTTLRWFKHMLTFANWLPYVVRKVERHSGRDIELTTLERKLPIVFLWPRAIHVLLTRPKRESEP